MDKSKKEEKTHTSCKLLIIKRQQVNLYTNAIVAKKLPILS